MPIHNVHLAQTPTARGWDKSIGVSAKDAQLINGFLDVEVNPTLGTKTVYVQKRPGSTTSASIASNVVALQHHNSAIANLFATSTNIYTTSATLGTISGGVNSVNNYVLPDGIVGSTGVVAFADVAGSGYYLFSDAISNNFPTFSASLTSGQATAVNIASTTGIYDGQLLSGSGIPAGTRVSDILNSSMVLLNANATESGTKTITKEAIAKIIDAQFPTSATSLAYLDGYFFACGSGNTIYQSAINDPSSWSTADTVSADYAGDNVSMIFRWQGHIVAAGARGTIQYFANAGNATGSVLSPQENLNLTGLEMFSTPVSFDDGGYCVIQRGDAGVVGVAREMGLYRLSGINTFTPVTSGVLNGVISELNLSQVGSASIGKKHLVIVHGTDDACVLAHDASTGMTSYLLMDAAITSAVNNRFTKSGTSTLFLWAEGNTWTDSSSAYTLTIQTGPQDPASGLSCTDIWADLLADVEASGTATLSVSDDDYQNWVTKGSFDMTKNKKRVHALGFHDGPRAYRLQHSDNTNFRGQVLRVNVEPASR